MPITTYRPLPPEIKAIQDELEAIAAGYGLDFFETIFEYLDYEELSMFAAYGGFPIRYPHWRFGAEYDELMKSYSYGLSKIYEMVINTDPCYAYLLSANSLTDQKLVIAHVYGHCDFFKNNAWFAHTNRRMLDQMANHAAHINRYVDRHGYETVERFIDACLSLEDLIDRTLRTSAAGPIPTSSAKRPRSASRSANTRSATGCRSRARSTRPRTTWTPSSTPRSCCRRARSSGGSGRRRSRPRAAFRRNRSGTCCCSCSSTRRSRTGSTTFWR
jgi:spore cortex formation protein SpoVR/YcgB (stage V sporulation)